MKLYAYEAPEKTNWLGWHSAHEYVVGIKGKKGPFFSHFLKDHKEDVILKFYQNAIQFLNDKTKFRMGDVLLSGGVGVTGLEVGEAALVIGVRQIDGKDDFFVSNYPVPTWDEFKVAEKDLDPKVKEAPVKKEEPKEEEVTEEEEEIPEEEEEEKEEEEVKKKVVHKKKKKRN